ATPLHYAAEEGHLLVVQGLLKNKANPNAKDKYGRTPLHLAAGKKDAAVPVVKCLFENKATLQLDTWGRSPVYYCFSHKGVLEVLLDNGAPIEGREGDDQDTP